MPTDRFVADKATLRAELEKRARSRRAITYGKASALVKRASQELGKIPTSIKVEEAGKRMPDLGWLVVTVRTAVPGYIGPGDDARKKAIADQDAVFEGLGRADVTWLALLPSQADIRAWTTYTGEARRFVTAARATELLE